MARPLAAAQAPQRLVKNALVALQMRQDPPPDRRRQKTRVCRVRLVGAQLAEAGDVFGETRVFARELVDHRGVDEAQDLTQVDRFEFSVQKDRGGQDENRLDLLVTGLLRQLAQAVVVACRGGHVDTIETLLSHGIRLADRRGHRP